MYLYNSKLADPARLEKMLFGRRETVDWLEKIALLFAETGKATHSLLIGNRGMGKSHLMNVLFHRLTQAEVVQKKLVIAYLEEDPYGISDYFDLLRHIINAIAKKEQNSGAKQRLLDAHKTLIGTEPKLRIPTAERILLEYLAGRRMLVLVENLNLIFEALGEEGQSRWRDFLQANDNTMICATAQAIFSAVQQRERSFFGFFHVSYLQKLQFPEARDLLLAMAEEPKNDELRAYIDTPEGEAKLRAIFELTEGNHRLLVAFYEFFIAEFRSELSKSFLRTIDQLKPYYESFLKVLPPQQQKIVRFLVMERIPQTGRTIADNCFLPINALSKQMSELQRLGYVQNTRQGRDAYYEITEPMLRICLESNENTDGILSIFVDFLGNLYPIHDLKFHFLRFHLFAEIAAEPGLRNKMVDEAYLYQKAFRRSGYSWEPDEQELLQVREAPAYEQEQMMRRVVENSEFEACKDEFDDLIKAKKYREAELLLDQAFPNRLSHYYWRLLGFLLAEEGRDAEAEAAFKKAIDIKSTDDDVWLNLGVLYMRSKNLEKAIYAFSKVLEIDASRREAWYYLVNLFIYTQQIDKAEERAKQFVTKYDGGFFDKIGFTFHFEALLGRIGKDNAAFIAIKNNSISFDLEYALALILIHLISLPKTLMIGVIYGDGFKMFLKKDYQDILPRALQIVIGTALNDLPESTAHFYDFHAALSEVFGQKKSMHYPLKFLALGIRYVKENDPKALLELTLEERRVFEREVLGKVQEGDE